MVVRQFCDLNVQESTSYPQNLANIKQLISLGYTVVALNRHYGLPRKEHQKGKKNPNEKSSMDEAKKYVEELRILHESLNKDIEKIRANQNTDQTGNEEDTVGHHTEKATVTNNDNELKVPEKFKLLSRVTFELDSIDQLSYLRSHSNKLIMEAFDLIAVYPKCEKCFRSLMEGKLDFDIVTFPMEDKLPFKLDRHQIGLGTSKGLTFEVNFSVAIKSQSLRKYVFMNSQSMVSKTKRAAGVIVNSGGESRMDFRAPPDVANLCNLLFATNDGALGLHAISSTPRKMITRALLRRQTFKGAVRVEKIVEEEEPESKEDGDLVVLHEEPAAKKRKI